jgi:hypothetical protein
MSKSINTNTIKLINYANTIVNKAYNIKYKRDEKTKPFWMKNGIECAAKNLHTLISQKILKMEIKKNSLPNAHPATNL